MKNDTHCADADWTGRQPRDSVRAWGSCLTSSPKLVLKMLSSLFASHLNEVPQVLAVLHAGCMM